MLAGANPSGVFTVSLNPAAPTLSQPATSSIQSFPSASAIILPQPVQQVGQGTISQLVSGSQIVNLTPVRATNQTVNTTPTSKNHSCPFCHKSFSSRYNVTRHEKICKLNTSVVPAQTIPMSSAGANNKQFLCINCQKSFQSQDSLNRHQKKCKAENSVALYKQPAVNISSVAWSSRKVHLCKFCGKEFSTKWNVIRHERLFHDPNDPIVVSQSVANGMPTAVTVVSPPGKPERYCRFCGNYFSSKFNAIRHEKICTRVHDNASNDAKIEDQNPQQPQPPTIQLQQPPVQPQANTQVKPLQITSITGGSQTILIPDQAQQQTTQQDQQRLQQQMVQQQLNPQVQQQPHLQTTNLQTNQQQQPQQQQQILSQQTMLLIEQPTTPFHVCKFCNKQLSTRCDPGSHNLLSNMQTVATITGQPMQIGSTGPQLAGLVTPVMASLPQVTLVQPNFTTLQGQQIVQQQQPQIQVDKDRLQAQQPDQQTNPQNEPVAQQQITLQHIRLPQQQQQQPQQQQTVQQNGPTVERPHACKFCDKHFASKWYLDQHEKIHTGDADMCKECGKYFVTRWHLDKHMRVHMSAEPSAKKSKKDAAVTTAPSILTANTVLTSHVSTIDFPEVIIGPGLTSNPANSSVSRAETFTVSSRDLQHFLPSVVSHTTQVASSASTSTQVTSSHAEDHSTIDKSQIASTLSMSYS